MSAEILLILLVAVIAFGPNKIPMLANHLGKAIRMFHQFRQQITEIWQSQIHEEQLKINKEKAAQADEEYTKRS